MGKLNMKKLGRKYEREQKIKEIKDKQIIKYVASDGYTQWKFDRESELSDFLYASFKFALKNAQENNYPDLKKIEESVALLYGESDDVDDVSRPELLGSYYYRAGKYLKLKQQVFLLKEEINYPSTHQNNL